MARLYPGAFGSISRAAGNLDRVRIMFAVYVVLILGGLALWFAVGLVID